MTPAKKSLQFNFDADAFARRAPQPMKLNQGMYNLIGEIIDKHGNKSGSLNQKRYRQIYLRFIDTHLRKLPEKFDTFSRVRRLAQVLAYSENELPRIIDRPVLCYALQLIESRLSIGALRGVCSAFRQAQDTPYAQILGAFIKKHQNNSKLVHSRVKLSNILHDLKLPDYAHGYRYFGAVEGAYKSISRPCDKSTVADIVEFAAKKHKDDLTNREILSELIEQLGNDASEHLRQPVQSYVLQEWRAPRSTGENWKGVSDKARRIFTRWIRKKDFHFFFDVIGETVDNPGFEDRKAFWLAYFEYISFCLLVLRRDVEGLFEHSQDLQYYQDRRPATLMGSAENQHAFIFQMENHIFVEFSTAPMCYVYDNINCPFRLNSSEYNMSELLNLESFKERLIRTSSKNDSWQNKFASWIATELGIKPLRSYWLDGKSNSYTISARGKARENY